MKTSASFSVGYLLVLVCAAAWFCTAAPGRAASGRIYVFTSNPALEEGTNNFGGFLRSLGYTVTIEQNAGTNPYEILDVIGSTNQSYQAELIAELTGNYDLIIIHRNYGSGTLATSAAEVAIWNTLNLPILLCNAPIARNNRWKWFNTASSGALPAPKDLVLFEPDHPIMAGLNPDLFVTNGVVYGGVFNQDSTRPDGGPNAHVIAQANVTFNPPCLAVWDENGGQVRGFYEGSGQTYVRRRVFFEMPEYRNGGTWEEISQNGNRMWANAVAYAMTGVVPPTPPAIYDITPAPGSTFNDTATTFSFRASSAQPIPTGGIQVVLNGQDVSGSLQFAGSEDNRAVSYVGLVPGQLYDISITVSNVNGVSSAIVQFDTFVAEDVIALIPDGEDNFGDFFSPSVWRVFVRVSSQTPQVVSLMQSNSTEFPETARLKGVFYLPGQMSAPALVPLTDALGNRATLRMPEDFVWLLLGPKSNVIVSNLLFVPATDAPATLLPRIGRAAPFPGEGNVSVLAELDLELIDADTEVVPGAVRLWVDGTDVTGSPELTVTDTSSGANVHYRPPNFLAPSQTHTVQVAFADNADTAHTLTNVYAFTTVAMPAIPPSLAATPEVESYRGFNLRLHYAPDNTDPVFTNNSARAELQLAGLLAGPSGSVVNGLNGTSLPSFHVENNVINYNAVAADTGRLPGDILFPSGDAVTPSHVALEATAYLQLPAGISRFGVASDDGFRLTAGHDDSVMLGAYEGTRGDQVPTEFSVLVYQAGFYPVRLVYFDGGGSASVEFYTLHDSSLNPSTGGRVLVNGQDAGGAVPVPASRCAPPNLGIAREEGELVLTWSGSGGFQLQESASLRPAEWTPISQAPLVQGWLHTVRLTPSGGTRFYRLELQP